MSADDIVLRLTRQQHYDIGVILMRHLAEASAKLHPLTEESVAEFQRQVKIVDAFGFQLRDPSKWRPMPRKVVLDAKRHPPDMTDDGWCQQCGADPLDPVHWPPRGWKEHLLAYVGRLR